MTTRILMVLLAIILCVAIAIPAFSEDATDTDAENVVAVEEEKELVDINLGAKGEDVKELQTRLTELGYYTKAIDGDYGNGTKTAVISFQSRNGLEETGNATVETLTILYSEDAIPAPRMPELSITKVSWSNGSTSVSITNNMDVAVDSIGLCVTTYDVSGNVYSPINAITVENAGLGGTFHLNNKNLQPGKSGKWQLDTYDIYDLNTRYVSVGICEFHTADGNTYTYKPQQMYLHKSDNSVVFPTDETEPDVLTDADYSSSKTVSFGVSTANIYPWTSGFYLRHEGTLIIRISEGSTFDQAGFVAGDVVISFDDLPALSGNSWEYAKLKMLKGEIVTVHYWRSNKEYTTQIALDMDSLSSEAEEPESDSNIAEQLAQLAELVKSKFVCKIASGQ